MAVILTILLKQKKRGKWHDYHTYHTYSCTVELRKEICKEGEKYYIRKEGQKSMVSMVSMAILGHILVAITTTLRLKQKERFSPPLKTPQPLPLLPLWGVD